MPGESPVDPLQDRLALLGALTRGALHELGNPLLALIGTADLAVAEAEPGSRLRRRLDLIAASANEIADVVRALQRVARVGGEEPTERLDLAAETAGTVALVGRLAPARGNDLESPLAGAATWVDAPPGALLLALTAILLGALESAPPGAVRIAVTESGGRAAVAVAGARAGGRARALAAAAGATLDERPEGVALVLPSAV